MKKLLSIMLVMLCAVAAHAYESPYSKLGTTLNRTFKVKGGVGITQFASAIESQLPIDKDMATIDTRNGYIEEFSEGDGGYHVYMAMWTRTDGVKIFVVSYCISETVAPGTRAGKKVPGHYSSVLKQDGTNYLYNVGYRAFIYDASDSSLHPADLMVDGEAWETSGNDAVYLILPQKGKDIEINFGTEPSPETLTLKWTGMGWEFESDNGVGVFIMDKTYPVNVRKGPSGKVVDTLGEGDMIRVDRCENGWFHIMGDTYASGDDGSSGNKFNYDGDKWVHRSVIAASWTGAAPRVLKSKASESSSTVFRGTQGADKPGEEIDSILDMDGQWLKVRLQGGKEGWTQVENICGNSLTTCP